MSKARTSKPASAAPDDGAADLGILYPERRQTIAGVAVTMREYGFVEGVQLAPLVEVVVSELADVAFSGDRLTPHALRPAFATATSSFMLLAGTLVATTSISGTLATKVIGCRSLSVS